MAPSPGRFVPVMLVLALAFAGDALADASVGLEGGTLGVRVAAGTPGNHDLIVEPFKDDLPRDGWRVAQGAFGVPAIVTSDADCVRNPLANDVICTGPRSALSVTMADGADTVRVEDRQRDANVGGCTTGLPFTAVATVNLGGGADRLIGTATCQGGTIPEIGFSYRFNANGGAGDDTMDGTPGNDTMGGGPGNDVVRGLEGNDALSGATGTDTLDGGSGDDTFCCSSTGSATIIGGPGIDSVTYSPTTARVGVTIGDDSNGDGLVGITNDKVRGSVENVTSGSGNDALVGDGGDNGLFGNAGDDVLRGEGGADRVVGGDGADTLIGGAGVDVLDGGPGDDTIDARDGTRDVITCGPGADSLTLDLREPFPLFGSGCEGGARFALDDGRPGAVIGRALVVRSDGTAGVPFTCPRAARIACRGVLTLRAATAARRLLARAAYAVPRGRRAHIPVTLASAPRTGARVLAATTERGVSALGPRTTQHTLVVRSTRV